MHNHLRMSYLVPNINHLMAIKRVGSVKALAEAAGILQPTLQRVMKGRTKNPNDDTVEPLAAYFGVSVSDLKWKDLRTPGPAGPSQPVGFDRVTMLTALRKEREFAASRLINYGSGDEAGAIMRAYDHLFSGASGDVALAILDYIEENGGSHARRQADGAVRGSAGGKDGKTSGKPRR